MDVFLPIGYMHLCTCTILVCIVRHTTKTSMDRVLHVSREDVEDLLQGSLTFMNRMEWSLQKSPLKWKGVVWKSGRVYMFNFSKVRFEEGELEALRFPQRVRVLHLGCCEYPNPRVLKSLRPPPCLQELYLDYNNIGVEGAEALPFLPSLQVLSVSNNKLRSVGARIIADKYSNACGSLTSLNLCDNHICMEGKEDYVIPRTLKELLICSNPLGLPGLAKLCSYLPATLKHLQASQICKEEPASSQITRKALQDLRFPYFLDRLSLCTNRLNDFVVQNLKLPPRLLYLNLSFNRITNTGVHFLRLPPQLQELLLNNNSSLQLNGLKRLPLPPSLCTLYALQSSIRTNAHDTRVFYTKDDYILDNKHSIKNKKRYAPVERFFQRPERLLQWVGCASASSISVSLSLSTNMYTTSSRFQQSTSSFSSEGKTLENGDFVQVQFLNWLVSHGFHHLCRQILQFVVT